MDSSSAAIWSCVPVYMLGGERCGESVGRCEHWLQGEEGSPGLTSSPIDSSSAAILSWVPARDVNGVEKCVKMC